MNTGSHKLCRHSSAFLLALLLLAGGSPVRGQSSNRAPDDDESANDEREKDQEPAKEKRGSLVIAPIPISSPAFGSGLLLITAYVFKVDKEDQVSPPSWGGVAGAFTNNGSRGLATGAKLLITAYVFKVDKEDQVSPPSWGGVA